MLIHAADVRRFPLSPRHGEYLKARSEMLSAVAALKEESDDPRVCLLEGTRLLEAARAALDALKHADEAWRPTKVVLQSIVTALVNLDGHMEQLTELQVESLRFCVSLVQDYPSVGWAEAAKAMETLDDTGLRPVVTL